MGKLHTNVSVSDQSADNETEGSTVEDMNRGDVSDQSDNEIEDDDSRRDADSDKENAESLKEIDLNQKLSPDETAPTATAQYAETETVERGKGKTAEEEESIRCSTFNDADSTATAQSPSPSEEERAKGPSFSSFPPEYLTEIVLEWVCSATDCDAESKALGLTNRQVKVLNCGHFVCDKCAEKIAARLAEGQTYRCEKKVDYVHERVRCGDQKYSPKDMRDLPVAQHIKKLREDLRQRGLPCYEMDDTGKRDVARVRWPLVAYQLKVVDKEWMFNFLTEYFRCTSCGNEYHTVNDDDPQFDKPCQEHPVLLDCAHVVCSGCTDNAFDHRGVDYKCKRCNESSKQARPLSDLYIIRNRNVRNYKKCAMIECDDLHAPTFISREGKLCMFCLEEASNLEAIYDQTIDSD